MQRFSMTLVAASLAAGCVTQEASTTAGFAAPEIAPALVVERFLRAANASDLATMARLFGTRDGSVLKRDTREAVEQRMFVLASALRHDDYALAGERIAPGRLGNAVMIIVRMRVGERDVPVPFTLVRTADDSWLVEQIDIERITARRR